jgi:hypothetical protein
MKEDCEREFSDLAVSKEYKFGFQWRWTFEKLLQDVSVISGVDASVNGEGYDPSWTVRTKNLVSILRDERYKAQRARMQEIVSRGRRSDSE